MTAVRRVAPRGAGAAGTRRPPGGQPTGIELVATRPLVERALEVTIALRPGDRPRVSVGDSVAPGTPLVDRLLDGRLVDVAGGPGRPGDRWSGPVGGRSRRRATHPEGERLFEANGRWQVVAGEQHDPLVSPVTGIVRAVRPGFGITVRTTGGALHGVLAIGDATRGRLEIAASRDGELLPRSLDVGSSGAILVVGARVDAEALTRARAMGIRGLVAATLGGKDRRDYLASDRRQRSGLHRLPDFGLLVLHGAQRRAISESVMDLLERLAGRDVAIVGSPPALVFDADELLQPGDQPDAVHVRAGPHAGRRGTWVGPAGLRRFPSAVHLESALVRFGEDAPIALPMADLERLT